MIFIVSDSLSYGKMCTQQLYKMEGNAMSKTAVITARIEPGLKESVEHVFARLGLTTTQAITLFLRQVELQQGLPFTLKVT